MIGLGQLKRLGVAAVMGLVWSCAAWSQGVGGVTATAVGGPFAAATAASAAAPTGAVATSVPAPMLAAQFLQVSPADAAAAAANPPPAESPAGADDDALRGNDFQSFIRQSTGHDLPLYGMNLFSRGPGTFTPVQDIPVTPDYTLAAGDELKISVWGSIEFSYTALVDRAGTINIPRIGSFSIAGVRYKDLERHLRNEIGRYYKGFDLAVSLGRLHAIPIFVVGHAARPGSYTVSSLSTLVTALFASGGPSGNGSMRAIQLRRGGETVTTFDLYDFIARGETRNDARLLAGDVIYIPPVGKLVAISGAVKQPAIFEMKPGAAGRVKDVLDLAGGLTTTASDQLVTIERIEDRKARKVDEFALDAAGLARPLAEGDLLTLYPISPKFDNAVTLRGNVATPLRFAYKPGMRVSDLIPDVEVLITPDYYQRLNDATRTVVASDQALRNDVKRNVKELNWDYAVIERLNRADITPELLPFNLGKAILKKDPQHDLPLQPGDVVTVFSHDDLNVPIGKVSKFVRVEGEVAAAGVYKLLPGETLRQLLTRIGGLTPASYVFGAKLTRPSVRADQEKRFREMVDQLELNLSRKANESLNSAATDDQRSVIQAQVAAQKTLIAKLRSLKPDGRIVLELDGASAAISDLPDIVLEDGDAFSIPPRPAFVTVMGAVHNPNAFIYKPGKSSQDYIGQAGGVTRDGEGGESYILRADGTASSRSGSGWLVGFGGMSINPGDTIVVPERLERFSWTKELRDWTQIMYQFGMGIAGLKVLRDL